MTVTPFFFHSLLLFFFDCMTFSTHAPSGVTAASRQFFLCLGDTFILAPVPLSFSLWPVPREIVFSTVLMEAVQSPSLLSGPHFRKGWPVSTQRLHRLIHGLDSHPFSSPDKGPFTKQNNKINPVLWRDQEQGPGL